MPMKPGSDRETISANIREAHTGPQYARTKRKFGKKTAQRQAAAAALNTARKSKKRKPWRKAATKRKPARRRNSR